MSERLEELVVGLEEWRRSHFFGKYRAQVVEVGEGDQLGKIRALVPEVLDEQISPWAQPSVPFAGSGHGWVTLPEVGDGVWVEFEAGMLDKPIWSGFWWAAGEIPDPAAPLTRLFATTAGHQLILDDDGGEVSLKHADGPSLVLTASDITLKVGGKEIKISSSGVSINQGALEVT